MKPFLTDSIYDKILLRAEHSLMIKFKIKLHNEIPNCLSSSKMLRSVQSIAQEQRLSYIRPICLFHPVCNYHPEMKIMHLCKENFDIKLLSHYLFSSCRLQLTY